MEFHSIPFQNVHSIPFQIELFHVHIGYSIPSSGIVILLLYVDDMGITGDRTSVLKLKKLLIAKYKMKDLEEIHWFLGLRVARNQSTGK